MAKSNLSNFTVVRYHYSIKSLKYIYIFIYFSAVMIAHEYLLRSLRPAFTQINARACDEGAHENF